MSKRLVVCCDGTWQKADSPYPTNVAKLFQAIPIDPGNVVFYGEGVGTGDLADQILGGALGWGIDKNIQDAYRFLCSNYSFGDQIYLFGFSRGAYTVRSLAGLIRATGMLPRSGIRQISEAYEAYQDAKDRSSNQPNFNNQKVKLREITQLQEFRRDLARQYGNDYHEEIEVTFLGCWDTVGALGIPDQIPLLPIDQILNRKYQFHDTQLSSKILHACHAVSIDENRQEFDFTKMEPAVNASNQVKQVWFPGGHGCVGGGTKANSPLANAALLWMIKEVQALSLGLNFDLARIEDGIQTDPRIFFSSDLKFPFKRNKRKIPETDMLHPSVSERWQACPWYRPLSLASEAFKDSLGESSSQEPVGLLAAGKEAQFIVEAEKNVNHTGIEIEEGGTYTVSVSPLQIWQDADIYCSAAGWKTAKSDDNEWSIQGLETQKTSATLAKFYQFSKSISRNPEAELMELVIEVGSKKYRISSDLSIKFTADNSGELIAYANDVWGFYQNNQGWIFATINRTN